MNPILQNKLNELENAKEFECWYLVKQPTDFANLCYLVSFLEDFKKQDSRGVLQNYISQRISELNTTTGMNISDNYRALRVAAFFGLITMTSSRYEDAEVAEAYDEIKYKCGGKFENKELYSDIIQRQIEKMFISSEIDEQSETIRKNYRLYPVMLLYKVLIEIGRSSGKYEITTNEYRYLVATTKVFEDFLETLLLIKLLREEPDANDKFAVYKGKFDNRLIQALKQLTTLEIDNSNIRIKDGKVSEVAEKVYSFESNPNIFSTNNYLEFLGSNKSLFDLKKENENADTFETTVDIKFFDNTDRINIGNNILLYGVPGAGKSWVIEHKYCKKGSNIERVVFHPDYSHADFIGQIFPDISNDGKVKYVFKPGPFTSILKQAYLHPKEEYYLIIEELNRGNAPAIFGEIFQLLDRIDETSFNPENLPVGTSEYGITNKDIAKIVYEDETHKVRIPSNLAIVATMNTSDQNVFTLDTAFQRRWEMHLVENDFSNVDPEFKNHPILDSKVSWQIFCEEINRMILVENDVITSSEDKRIGAYFVKLQDLEFDARSKDSSIDDAIKEMANRNNSRFAEKVLKYLWDDAFKYSRDSLFDTTNYKSLEDVIKKFTTENGNARFDIFIPAVRENLISKIQSDSSENNTREE